MTDSLVTATALGQAQDRIDRLTFYIERLTSEVNLLSGRVDLTMRLIARIVAHMDQSFLDDPNDPEVRRRSELLGETVLEKMKAEALGLATGDPEQTNRLHRYFKDVP
jgi:hypothetical protein